MEMGTFARTILDRTYAQDTPEGKESWDQLATRVTKNVMRAVGVDMRTTLAKDIRAAIAMRKFMPAGRYLYSAGRPFHQCCNCLLLRAHDSREGWSELVGKACKALMTGAGVGVVYSDVRHEGAIIRKTGGVASGPIPLMQMINECGRGVMQGGSRRSAIWAGLHWNHPDSHKFVRVKNWPDEIVSLKTKDFSFPAPFDHTNISVILDDEFFEAYGDDEHHNHSLAHSVYWAVVEQMLRTGEPGFTVDTGKNNGENLRNAPLSASTWVLTDQGYKQIGSLVGKEAVLWTGKQWATNCVFQKTKAGVQTVRVIATGDRCIDADPEHEFFVERYKGKGAYRHLVCIEKVPAGDLEPGDILHTSLPQMIYPEVQWQYVRGFIFGDGSVNGNRSEVTLCCDEKKALLPYLSDGYVSSITENDSRGYTRVYYKNAGHSKEYPNLSTPHVASWLAGLFDADGSYDEEHNYVRLSQPMDILVKVRRDLERIGIRSSIARAGKSGYTGNQCYLLTILASDIQLFALRVPTKRLKIKGFRPYRDSQIKVVEVVEGPVEDVFCCNVHVEEHSFTAEGVIVSNCCEVTSRDTDDICNLGSINLGNVDDIEEFKHLIDIGTAFLLAGSVYTDVPYTDVDKVLSKNRRLGLGVMGLHEWLLRRGKPYGPDEELGLWLNAYSKSQKNANHYSDEWGLCRPKKVRAIAPTGTIGIVAETTGGIEPIFCVAYKRRYLKGKDHYYQYVIDPVAKRLIKQGIDPTKIEDAYDLARDVERRVAFQAWVQQYVDHAISSTINLPSWGSEDNNADLVRPFGSMLIRYLPQMRGITTYPDGSRGGQPLNPVPYSEAMSQEGVEMVEEQKNVCSLTGGSCGD
jgi:ribonucleotide reductase alpha subunit